MKTWIVIVVLAACSKKEEDAPKVAGGDPDEGGQVTQAGAPTPAPAAAKPEPPPPPPPAPPPDQPKHKALTGDPSSDYPVGATRLPGRHMIVPNMKLGTVKVVGALPDAVVSRIVRQHNQQLRYCYEQWLRDDNTAKGTVTVRFAIAATGAVSTAEIKKPLHDSLDACVVKIVQSLEFPKPEKDTVDATVTLEFFEATN